MTTVAGDQYWFIYHNGQQLGPFGSDQLKQLHANHMIAQDAYLFKVGWKDWRPLEQCLEEFGLPPVSLKPDAQRVQGAPRASIQGRVIVHNNGQLAIGSGVNISATGIFVETNDEIFTIGEKLKLSVRCDGIKKPFNVIAQVIRFNVDPRFPVGYGLKFDSIDPDVSQEIEALVSARNQNRQAAPPIAK
jgi:hypothetical protein